MQDQAPAILSGGNGSIQYPSTGNNHPSAIWLAILALSLAGIALLY